MSASTFHGTGVHFGNGYRSEGLAHILESVMQHPAAAAPLNEAFDRLGSPLAEPVLA
jgi:hypothetical protein